MRDEHNRIPSVWDRFTAFVCRFSPWLILHLVFGLCFGMAYGVTKYGAEGAESYYTPLAAGAVTAAALAAWAYFIFGRSKSEYETNRLGGFDKKLISSFFSGRNAVKLREAVIDMHLSDLNGSLEKLDELYEKELSDECRAAVSFYLGRCYQLMGYPANGAKYFREALDLGLELHDTYLLAARCLVQNGRFDEAIEYYNILLEKKCYFDFIYTDMGIAYLKKGDGEKALEMFDRSVKEGKNYSFALGGCALAYLQMKDIDKSREYYKQALNCNMDDVNGFKIFYCNIAESVGLTDEIDPIMKRRPEPDDIIR